MAAPERPAPTAARPRPAPVRPADLAVIEPTHRIRSAIALAALITTIAVIVAVTLGAIVLVIGIALKQAIG